MSKPAERDIKDVWIEYKKTRAEPLRNRLMENYLHLVRFNAERIHNKLPDEVELDDLMSAGIFGLMDAIQAFDMERGVKLGPYCPPRIRGDRWTGCHAWSDPAPTSWTAPAKRSKPSSAGLPRRTRSPGAWASRWRSSRRS